MTAFAYLLSHILFWPSILWFCQKSQDSIATTTATIQISSTPKENTNDNSTTTVKSKSKRKNKSNSSSSPSLAESSSANVVETKVQESNTGSSNEQQARKLLARLQSGEGENKTSVDSKHVSIRGPFLAEMELESRLSPLCKDILCFIFVLICFVLLALSYFVQLVDCCDCELVTACTRLAQLLVQYFHKFGHLPCFFLDVAKYLSLLTSADNQNKQSEEEWSKLIQELRKHMEELKAKAKACDSCFNYQNMSLLNDQCKSLIVDY